MKRNLTGMFFRSQDVDTGKFENICFEELPLAQQEAILETNSKEFAVKLALKLSETLNKVGETFDIGVNW